MCPFACSRYHSSLICLARSGSDQLDSVALTVSRTVFPLCFCVKHLDLTHGAQLSRSTEESVVSFGGGKHVLWMLFSYEVRLGGGILKMSHLCAEQTQPEGRAGLVLTPSV